MKINKSHITSIFAIIISIIISSCENYNGKKKNTNNKFINVNSLKKEKKLKNVPNEKSKSIKKSNIQTNNSLIYKIKSLPIQKLPYEFNKCNTGSLDNLEKSENLHKALRINTDKLVSLSPKKDTFVYSLNKDKIYEETKSYAPKYYYFLLDYIEESTIISFSKSFIYKRLKPIRNDIEILLLLTKIYDNDYGRKNVRGIQIDILTYNTKTEKSIDRKRLITTGIGLEDIAYHECFRINNKYDIITKSFMHLEDEGTAITRKLKIYNNGKIKILKQNVEKN